MRRTYLLVGSIAVVAVAAFVVLPLCGTTPSADAQRNWVNEFDEIAKEFRGEFVIVKEAEGEEATTEVIPLEGPRRMISYTPKTSERNSVFAGAVYALHISGNPEVVMAIENSRSAEDEEKVNTYIEISRLSGAAVNVYRNDEKVAEFPKASAVEGAYVGMTK